MDIGPVRRRLSVEPVVSPVSGDPAPRHEPAAAERGPAPRPGREIAEPADHAAPEHEAAPAARA